MSKSKLSAEFTAMVSQEYLDGSRLSNCFFLAPLINLINEKKSLLTQLTSHYDKENIGNYKHKMAEQMLRLLEVFSLELKEPPRIDSFSLTYFPMAKLRSSPF